MDKARKMCSRMEVWSRATYKELDRLLQACNQNWRKAATVLSCRRVSNQHLSNRELYVEEVEVGAQRGRNRLMSSTLMVCSFVWVHQRLGAPSLPGLCTECVEVIVKLALPCS